jgi:hypothetical protein
VLQRTDFPSTTRWSSSSAPTFERTLGSAGVKAKVGVSSGTVPRSQTEGALVETLVAVVSSGAQAKSAYKLFNGDLARRRGDVIRLPRYGDEQVALFTKGHWARVELRVRAGDVVWRLSVTGYGTEPYSRAQALADAKAYAVKQQRRVAAAKGRG